MFKSFLRASLILCVLVSNTSYAQDMGQRLQDMSVRMKNALKSFYKKHPQKFTLNYEQNYFYAPKPKGEDFFSDRNMGQIGFGYKGHSRRKTLNADFNYFYSEAEEDHYFNLREAYSTQRWPRVDLHIGRKKHNWSRADQYWGMGIWQPRFMWSRIRPEQNGLTGFFLQGSVKNFQWTTFASPFNIPEMGPKFKYQNDQFSSANPWFRAPAPYATVPGVLENKKIIYSLNTPDVEQVALQASGAFQLKWQKGSYFCQMSYAYKPMNQIVRSVDPLIRIDLPGSPPGVDVYPFVSDHRVIFR